jgi:hypothetical protein
MPDNPDRRVKSVIVYHSYFEERFGEFYLFTWISVFKLKRFV